MSDASAPVETISRLADVPSTVDHALHQTVGDMLAGARVETAKDTSYEVLHYRTGMTNARARVCVKRRLNIVGAVARFVWMIAGSNRLHDIMFYEPKVSSYTDDGISVPGSSYGKRLFDPAPGLDQIRGVIARLAENSDTRQAAAVVWLPEDAVRNSRDIPCTFGMFFHVRDGQLVMKTVMRSNNAFRLLPYNFFEFSMLGEVVAATLGVEMGPYLHDAASMHVYADNFEWNATKAVVDGPPGTSLEMPPMPRPHDGRVAIDQASELARLEARLRHGYTLEEFAQVEAAARASLDDYWLDLFGVLAAWGAAARGWAEVSGRLVEQLPSYFYKSARDQVAKQLAATTAAATPPAAGAAAAAQAGPETDPEMLPLDLDVPVLRSLDAATQVDAARERANRDAVIVALMEFRLSQPDAFEQALLTELADILTVEGSFTAARSAGELNPDDALEITDDDIRAALRKLRGA